MAAGPTEGGLAVSQLDEQRRLLLLQLGDVIAALLVHLTVVVPLSVDGAVAVLEFIQARDEALYNSEMQYNLYS